MEAYGDRVISKICLGHWDVSAQPDSANTRQAGSRQQRSYRMYTLPDTILGCYQSVMGPLKIKGNGSSENGADLD